MSVPTARHGSPRRLPFMIALATLIGLVSAVVLVVGPAAGAPESAITGSVLIAFAFGWACLAGLTIRFTSQPQRWALVPAASMAVVGLGLIATAPGSDAIDTLGWLWPPALLVLVAWTARGLRSQLAGRSRWLVHPLLAVLALSSVGGAVETIAEQAQRGTLTATGQLVDIGGRRMHIDCAGSGSPTVVLQSGAGEASYYWARIEPAVAATTRVCVYDRAGHGGSDASSTPQDGSAIAADLHALLAASGNAGPYVLVGHSTGGPFIQVFAAMFPTETAGMVFLDAQPAEAFTALPDYSGMYPALAMVSAIVQPLARMGVMRLANGAAFEDLPEPARAAQQAYRSSGRAASALRDDLA
ncbi:MAG TPA: alpha/beta hydrolase, partial [Candidatus Limnocylindrales bacterium]|nr:alpha/beta hydrolase [Candidatus Limnocylindrales bacterium]